MEQELRGPVTAEQDDWIATSASMGGPDEAELRTQLAEGETPATPPALKTADAGVPVGASLNAHAALQ